MKNTLRALETIILNIEKKGGFEELGKSERSKIAKEIHGLLKDVTEWEIDGETDGCYICYEFPGETGEEISIWSSNEEYYSLDGILNCPTEIIYSGYEEPNDLLEWISKEINKEIKLINLTPHAIMLIDDEYNIIQTIESSGFPPVRATEKKEKVGELAGVPVYKTTFENVVNLPDTEEGVFYIVSRIIVDACTDRNDLVTTSSIVRKDDDGNLSNHPFAKGAIIGCQAFSV